MTQKRFSNALEGYQDLCETLEKHVRRPHDYYLQCRSGIAHCIWNLYCTQFPEKPIDEFDESSRDLAKEIYKKSNLVEEVPPEYEYTGPPPDSEVNSDELTAEDKEKAALLEATKKMLDESSQRKAEARDGTEALKKESEEAKQAQERQAQQAQQTQEKQAQAETAEEPPKSVVKSAAEIALEKEQEEERVAKQKKKGQAEKEQEEKRSRKKQWEAEDNERKQRENERRKKRQRQMEENIRLEKEREKRAREMKKIDEEEKRQERERQWDLKQQRQREDHERQAKDKERAKRDEEYELAMLLSEIGNSFEPSDSVLIQLEAEQGKPPFKTERETGSDGPIGRRDTPGSVELNGNKEPTSGGANGAEMSDVATSPETGAVTCNKEGTPQTRGHSTANCDPDIAQEAEEKKEENVWSALRKIKEAKTTPAAVPPRDESETLTLDEFDNLIKNLSANLKKEVIKPEKLESVVEKDEEETKSKEEQSHQMIFNGNGSIDESVEVKEFVYDEWKVEMENLFGKTEEYFPPTEKSASDEAYLENLRRKIAETVKKQSKDLNQSEKQKELENKEKVANTPAANTNTPAANVNDFGLLKLKEKERKKRKKEAAFQNHVVESTDRLKEMSIKTAKIEKLSTETESELLKLREKAVMLVQKSAAKENEFEAIFKDIDNIDAMVFESDKKKKKGSKGKKEQIIAAIAEKNELHWTEEDRGKWGSCSSKNNHSKVSEVLSTMKAMACQGNSEVINSLKSTISHCQKVEEESKAEMMRVKEEKKKQAEEVKLQKDLENRAIQRKTQEQNGISSSGGTSGSLVKTEQAKKIPVAESKRLADKGKEEEVRKTRDLDEKIREGEKEINQPEVISSTSLSAEEIERLAEEEEEREILELERKIEQRRKEEEQLQADFVKQQKEQEMIKEKEMKHKAEQESNEKKKKIEEEQKKIEAKKREEEKQKKQKEEERKKVEEEKKKKAEEEKKNRREEEKRKKAEEEKKRRVEEEKRKRVKEENKKREEEEKRKRAEEETKKKLEEEIKRRDAEEQEKKRLEEKKNQKSRRGKEERGRKEKGGRAAEEKRRRKRQKKRRKRRRK